MKRQATVDLKSILFNPYLIIGSQRRGSRTGPLGSGPRAEADRGGCPESGNTPGFSWDGLWSPGAPVFPDGV